MKQRKLGNKEVSAIGIGCMNVSWIWSDGAALDPVRRLESAIPAIHAGLDAGITLLDTADIYAPTWEDVGHNEIFVAEALRTWSGTKEQKDKVLIATKGGITRSDGEVWGRGGSLDYLVRAAEASATHLGVQQLDLWQHHRLDPSIDFETQFENVMALKERGLTKQVGVSNYDAKQLLKAIEIGGTPDQGGLVSIQNEFSPRYRHDLDVLEICEQYGIAFFPWSPLGGVRTKAAIFDSSAFEEVASKYSASPYAIALAWEMKTSPAVLPIPGATRAETVLDCITATEIQLSDDDFDYLNQNLPTEAAVSDELTPKPNHRG
ncbi:MAG: aldo/keto reductase [Micrococcales bacterium]|jgi:aryl-alcohol dehydrogenase-like predicted oxidoreductase|nr:aldo/keto reductase [Micrococcales bacterium]